MLVQDILDKSMHWSVGCILTPHRTSSLLGLPSFDAVLAKSRLASATLLRFEKYLEANSADEMAIVLTLGSLDQLLVERELSSHFKGLFER